MRVYIKRDESVLGRKAASIVAEFLIAKPAAVLALPTGRTPLGLYHELVKLHNDEDLDFSRARIFNLDEYLGLPHTDERSFHQYLKKHFLSEVNAAPENVHLLTSTADDTACLDYERQITAAGGIDLLIAGVGTNGHIAFNEPGAALDSRTRIVDLAESTLTNMQAIFSPEEMPKRAVTVGIGTILEARSILVLASGEAKKSALSGLLNGPVTPENPVSIVRLHPDVTVIADQAAANENVGVRNA